MSSTYSFKVDNSIKQIFKDYESYDYFETDLKIKKYFRILYPFLNESSKNANTLSLLIKIKNIYNNGGLEKLSDDELNELKVTVEFLMNEPIQ